MNIAVRTPNWLGDVVMSAAFFQQCTHMFPGASIDAIARTPLDSLVSLFPSVNHCYPFPRESRHSVHALCRFSSSLRNHSHYDIFFCLPDSFSSAMMARVSAAPERIGYRGQLRSVFLTKALVKPAGLHRVEEYVSLLAPFGSLPQKPYPVRIPPPLSSGISTSLRTPYIIFHGCSEAVSRTVPLSKAISVVGALRKHFDVPVVLCGTQRQRRYNESIADAFDTRGQLYDLTGTTSLSNLCEILHGAYAVVATDSGVAHLANAVETKTVVLFGAGNEHTTAPYNRAYCKVVRASGPECQRCVSNKCRFDIPRCLEAISEEHICDALDSF
jgi:lipopolysaccharide heptosyltransferase II